MTGGDILAAVGSDDDELVRQLLLEMAWSAARRSCGLGFDEAPFSPAEAGPEHLGAMQAEFARLAQLLSLEASTWKAS